MGPVCCRYTRPTEWMEGGTVKTAKDYLDEANAVVPKIGFEEALAKHREGQALFIDVRDSAAIGETGTVPGAMRLPRGMVEFAADPSTPFHREALSKDRDIVLICGAGGQAALAGRTLKEMGFTQVSNAGGFPAWKEAGGPTEEG